LLIAESLQAADLPSPEGLLPRAVTNTVNSSTDLGSKFNSDPDTTGQRMVSIAQTAWLAARNFGAAMPPAAP
jgi:hypothetical protein